MFKPVKVSDLRLPQLCEHSLLQCNEANRLRTHEIMERYRKADEEIKRLCIKHGFELPDFICLKT